MTPEIKKLLEAEQPTSELSALKNRVVKLVRGSRSKMSERYESWDKQQEVYNGRKQKTAKDRRAEAAGVPSSMLLPLTFAQVQTFVSFCFLLFKQNTRMLELKGVDATDLTYREEAETVLEKDLADNKFSLLLYQFLQDMAKFGFGCFSVSWEVEKTQVWSTRPQVDSALPAGSAPTMVKQLVEVTKREGNVITNVSPYKVFPDMRKPLRDYQTGEFCSYEDEMMLWQLEGMEAQGSVAGVQYAKGMKDLRGDRGWSESVKSLRFVSLDPEKPQDGDCLVTKVQIRLIPAKTKVGPNMVLGPEVYPVIYLVWLLNDDRIIKLEPLDAAHGEFTLVIHELLPDIHEKMNLGLAEIISVLQELIGWFINARVEAVSRLIDNRLVVDETAVDMSSLKAGSRVIKLSKNANGKGVDHYVKQLDVRDTTTGHIGDAQSLMQIMQLVTGVNENAMGQYNAGRRSATEARAVTQGAAGRMRLLAELIWDGAINRLGRQLLLNSRQAMSAETFTKIVGKEGGAKFALFNRPMEELVGSFDHFVFDGTTPSEKSFLAQSLQELLAIVMSSPDMGLMLNLDPAKMIQEIYQLRGVNGLPRFGYSQKEVNAALEQRAAMASANAAGQTQGGGTPEGGAPPVG